jgi:hypothetical protein
MAIVGAVAEVVGADGSIYQGVEQGRAQRAQAKEEKVARNVENAVTRVENQQAIAQRVAAQRKEQANLESGAEASGVGKSSSLFASVGSSTTTAATDIGLAGARISGASGAAAARNRGSASYLSHMGNAAIGGTVASVSSLFSNPTRNEQIAEVFTPKSNIDQNMANNFGIITPK